MSEWILHTDWTDRTQHDSATSLHANSLHLTEKHRGGEPRKLYWNTWSFKTFPNKIASGIKLTQNKKYWNHPVHIYMNSFNT